MVDIPIPEHKEISENQHLAAEMVEFDGEQRYLRILTPSVLRAGTMAVAWLLPMPTTMVDHETGEQGEGFAFLSLVGETREKLEKLYQDSPNKQKVQ